MAIKRCPYCRALISDQDEFCKNCGTRLLFPEDEEIEEEIPGDKIIEDDRRQAKNEDWPESEDKPTEAFTPEQSTPFEEEAELEEGQAEGQENLEEVIVIDEEASPGQKVTTETSGLETRKTETKKTPEELIFSQVEDDLPFPEEEKEEKTEPAVKASFRERDEDWAEKLENLGEEILQTEEEDEAASSARIEKPEPGLVTRIVEELEQEIKQAEPSTPEKPGPGLVTQLVQEIEAESKNENQGAEEKKIDGTFNTGELEGLGPTIEIGQRQVEDFFKILEEKEKERVEVNKAKSETGESGSIPAWVHDLKEASTELLEPGPDESQQLEETEEEPYSSSPTMGFPEKVTRSQLELEEEEREEEEKERELEMEIEEQEAEEGTDFLYEPETGTSCLGEDEPGSLTASKTRGAIPLSPGAFIKAKVFDLLFMVLLWLLTIWLAAHSMQVTIFKLLGVAASSLLLFLLILVSVYFFLFYFFIGETLGDRLFRDSEE
ncbi:MAG TPA: hypothetical protein DCW97_00190 [Acidobacteria bacterium]|nr:hypothetical protein [Acidobacteriota bacterium]